MIGSILCVCFFLKLLVDYMSFYGITDTLFGTSVDVSSPNALCLVFT